MKECIWCGKKKNSNQGTFCSAKCRYKLYRAWTVTGEIPKEKILVLKCKECGGNYERVKGFTPYALTCSKKCSSSLQYKRNKARKAESQIPNAYTRPAQCKICSKYMQDSCTGIDLMAHKPRYRPDGKCFSEIPEKSYSEYRNMAFSQSNLNFALGREQW